MRLPPSANLRSWVVTTLVEQHGRVPWLLLTSPLLMLLIIGTLPEGTPSDQWNAILLEGNPKLRPSGTGGLPSWIEFVVRHLSYIGLTFLRFYCLFCPSNFRRCTHTAHFLLPNLGKEVLSLSRSVQTEDLVSRESEPFACPSLNAPSHSSLVVSLHPAFYDYANCVCSK